MSPGLETDDTVLRKERSVNERYQQAMKATMAKAAAARRQQASPRNTQWTGSSAAPRRAMMEASPLIGRVALAQRDPLLGTGFYLGSWHQEFDGVLVVSWAAPVAVLFYGRDANGSESASAVSGRRTFAVSGADLVGYVDEVQAGLPIHQDVFAAPERKLHVPAPPPRAGSLFPDRSLAESRARPSLGTGSSEQVPRMVETSRPDGQTPRPTAGGDRSTAEGHREIPAAHTDRAPVSGEVPTIRAEAAVRHLLERPRTGRLSSVLPTIQPDQYHLITWPAHRPLVIQGGPGTGKTIIAAHRAAYLVNPALEHDQLRHVGLVGPTGRYEDHVGPLVSDLTDRPGETAGGRRPGTVHVTSMAGLLANLAELKVPPQLELSRIGSDWALGRTAERAIKALREDGVLQPKKAGAIATVVNALARGHRALDPILADDPEIAEWLMSMGSFDRAVNESQYLPLLAAVGLALEGPPPNRFDHLVVDEGQDVTPIEWRILSAYLAPSGQLTILGDMNQRRSDWSASTWSQLSADLEITDDNGNMPVQELGTGYRTTREILRFADRLLPSAERTTQSLRSGPTPVVERVPAAELVSRAYAAANELAKHHVGGLVAVICMTPRQISDAFRRHGWSRPRMQDAWADDDKTVVLLLPDQARGLEFDAVIVVEPASFPLNLGRAGQLYTSLTRAVQELVVLHARPLPGGLRSR